MPYSFDTRKTHSSKALRISSFPLFKYSNFLSQLFFYIFLLSLFLIGFSFLGLVANFLALKIPIFFLALFLLFFEIKLFTNLKINNPQPSLELSEAVLNEKNCNLAEFLNLDSCKIVESSIKLCKKGKFSEVSSQALLYSALLNNKDIKILILRLGMDDKKLQLDLKNYLEKQQRGKKFNLVLSESFMKVIEEAANLSIKRGHDFIDERDISWFGETRRISQKDFSRI